MLSCGRVVLEDKVEIGAGCTIDRGVSSDTLIGAGTKMDNQVHIGHDCVIGDYFTTAPGVQISGNETIGNRVYFGTRSCMKQKLTICDDVIVGMNAGVVKNITEPGTYVGTPSIKIK